jgi:hypothetical protein
MVFSIAWAYLHTNLFNYIPTHLPFYKPTYLPRISHLPSYILTHQAIYLIFAYLLFQTYHPSSLPITYLPSSYFPPTYLLLLSTYHHTTLLTYLLLLSTYHPKTLPTYLVLLTYHCT